MPEGKDFEQAFADLRAWDERFEAAVGATDSAVVPAEWAEELSKATIREDADFVLPWNEDDHV